ncbi:MAG TPA: hypothetical protein VH591_04745 [Ktedonobacterales bacterium]|jgi:hypothetical protein
MIRRHVAISTIAALTGIVAFALAVAAPLAQADAGSFIGRFHTVGAIASTVPANGDVNPYGTVIVPRTVGKLVRGDILISNFNNSANLQGTGTTIVEITPGGHLTQFAQIDASKLPGACPGGVGLTTALVALKSGFVIVGSLPTTDGTSATAKAGCLIVLNSRGHVVETFAGGQINGPWDMTALDLGDHAALFVTNVLNGTVAAGGNVVNGGTVLRIGLTIGDEDWSVPRITSEKVIGSGFPERTDPAALVIGPTGVGLGFDGTLYVADSVANRVAAIPNAIFRQSASRGITVSRGGALNDPLGLTLAPNGHILTANGNDGFIVETSPFGAQVAAKLVDNTGSPPGAGTLFGLAVAPGGGGVYFVDDGSNTLNLLH